ncbi:MAG: acyl-CoA desaturase [Gammaproteobacteria bacterium]|nr:acyl-CoA desaturase [Gammaproteobacteria bacterium]
MERLPIRPHTRSRAARVRTAALIALIHVLPAWAIINGTGEKDWLLFAAIYPFQAIGVGVCLHRYFAHNAFKTSRWFQFLLALFCASTFGDPIRFAGKHRLHHLNTDRENDTHSPRQGFWFSWLGSHIDSRYTDEQICAQVPYLTQYPELMWLHRHSLAPGLTLCAVALLLGGISGMAVGVLLGAALLIHQSSAVNYFCHRFGRRRFQTDDLSTNNFLVSLLVFGEGWHNNHHRYPVSARAGFCWWEIDIFYWVICLWEAIGLVWDVRRPPEQLRRTRLLAT